VRRWGLAGFIGDAALILANRLEQEIGDYKKNLGWDTERSKTSMASQRLAANRHGRAIAKARFAARGVLCHKALCDKPRFSTTRSLF
jgi:hypothetical protein